MDRAQDDVSTDSASWNIYAAEVKTEPVVTLFAIVVNSDSVPIDTNTPIVVQIIGQHAKVTQSMKYFSIAVKDMELSGYGADTLCGCRVGNHFLVQTIVAPQRRNFQIFTFP